MTVSRPPISNPVPARKARRPLTIALMLESDGPGGAESMLLQLGDELRRRGHTIVPVGPEKGLGWLAEQFRLRGFTPEVFSLRRPIDWRCVAGLVRMLRARGVDVVHSHEFTMAVYGAAAARVLGLPQIVTMHGGTAFTEKRRRRIALRWAANRSRMVAVSESSRSLLTSALRLPPESVRVVPNGISFTPGMGDQVIKELGLADGEALILAVGNLYGVKGHDVLLRALSLLRASRPELLWKAVIAGRGRGLSRLTQLQEELGLQERCAFLGHRDDVADLLAAADVYVMPSLSEGLPIALLEAMFAAKPIVASRVGGIPEAVGSEGALLVPPGEPADLAEALANLLSDSDLARRLGPAAARRARDEFGGERMADRYEDFYWEAVGAH